MKQSLDKWKLVHMDELRRSPDLQIFVASQHRSFSFPELGSCSLFTPCRIMCTNIPGGPMVILPSSKFVNGSSGICPTGQWRGATCRLGTNDLEEIPNDFN